MVTLYLVKIGRAHATNPKFSGDVSRARLSPNTSDVIFIIKKQKDEGKVMDLGQTITDNLISKGIPKKELPRVHVYFILASEAKSLETVTEILTDLLL